MKNQKSKAKKAAKQRERRKAYEKKRNALHSQPGMKGYRVIGKTQQAIERAKQEKQNELTTNALGSHSATGND